MKLYIDKKVFTGFSFAVFFVVLSSIASYLSINNLFSNSSMVNHTHQVLEEISNISFLIDESDLSVFTHTINKNLIYIEKLKKTKASINNHLEIISELTSDNYIQIENISELKNYIYKKISNLEKIINSDNSLEEQNLSRNYINSENNEKLKEQIFNVLKKMRNEEMRLLEIRQSSTDYYINITVYILSFGTFFALFVIISSIYMINNDIKERKIVESKLRDNEINLEHKIEERTFELSHANKYLTHEINERKKVEKELRIANEELNNFAYVASHDLQEPLRTISSYTQLLKKRAKNKFNDEEIEFMNIVIDGSIRMKKLIEDLLEYSRIGRKEKNFEKVNLNKLLNNVIYNLKSSIDEKKAQINFNNMPVIYANEIEMMQLFQNLISNAIKYNKNTPVINISAKKENDSWLFSISDNGIGISKEYFEKIFVIFQRLHTKNEYSGTGIGLATCKKILEHHNGKIWVESNPDEGSSFYFTIST